MTLATRFWEKIEQTDGCWLWCGTKTLEGYGYVSPGRRGSPLSAHRLSYELHVGPIPNDLEIDHLCRNPSCVNPDHLEAVTHAENMRRGPGVKTHCRSGHEYTPDNTGVNAINVKTDFRQRRCLACHREHERERRARKAVNTL